ncbi:peptidase, U32 family [Streptococcus pneumoniae]|nr:peptidase, U32 family [Streptococcus pneumoniae]
MSAVDMSMIDHIPDMIENGVDNLKIEGRMEWSLFTTYQQ